MILIGDVFAKIAEISDNSAHCVVTSPPYWGLRNYQVEGQIGLEPTLQEYIEKMVGVFREVRRVLRDDGAVFLNLGDSYAGSGGPGSQFDDKAAGKYKDNFIKFDNPNRKAIFRPGSGRADGIVDPRCQRNHNGITGGHAFKPKDLCGVPWRVALALQNDGWWLRSDIIWSKPNPMPESVTDRPTKAHEYIFLLTKSSKYFWNYNEIRAEGRNLRTVWTISTQSFSGVHFATFPEKLVAICISAGCPDDGIVFDPFLGSGTVGVVAQKMGRRWIGIELNPKYAEMARRRIGHNLFQGG